MTKHTPARLTVTVQVRITERECDLLDGYCRRVDLDRSKAFRKALCLLLATEDKESE